MLAFVIFAVTFVVSLIIAVIYLYPGSKKPTTIPGLDPTSKEDGNLQDIGRAGSLHEFLMELHKDFGPIAGFWYGPQYTVSIASAKLFKEHSNVFDRPPVLYELFEPLIGPKSIQYANGTEGRQRRQHYDKELSHMAVKQYYHVFQEVADELEQKWSSLVKEEHIPLCRYTAMFALKSALISLFGDHMKSDTEILQFQRHYNVCWHEMELRLTEAPDSTREKAFQGGLEGIKQMVKDVIQERRTNPPDGELLIDLIMDYTDDEEQQISDSISYVVGSSHTTGNMLSWAFYFLATHSDVQEKVYQEIRSVLGTADVDHVNINELKYVRQVLDETLRCAVVGPYAARFQDFESELGGHKIPKNTPVIHALGVSLKDETVWPLPDKFDPDRFSPENCKKRNPLAFSPFGFAGKRICPGYRFSYADATVCFVTLLRKFKVHLVEGQVVTPVHGLVTTPGDEIWITISKRK